MRFTLLCSVLVAGLVSSPVSAAITAVSEDFEGFSNPGSFAPFAVFSDGAGLGSYFLDNPSTAGPQITALADDGAGNNFLNFFANYDNGPVHNNPDLNEAISIFQNQQFTAAESALGETWFFNFDFASNPDGPVTGTTQVGAFIRVFDDNFNLLDEKTFNTLDATAAFQGGALQQTLNPGFGSGNIQFGFTNTTGRFEGSGRFYDNVRFANTAAVPEPSSLLALALGGVSLAARRRRRR